jgi:hypothetical protein
MSKMVRKQVYIRADQERALKALSERTGRSEADLLRAALDLVAPPSQRSVDHSGRADELERVARAKHARGWTREDIYAERTERWTAKSHAEGRAWLDRAFAAACSALETGGSAEPVTPPAKFDREEAYVERLRKLLR